MIILKHLADIEDFISSHRASGQTIGFVPTMGALHDGHVQLLHLSRRRVQTAVCSIFINPTQFNDPADFRRYPVRMEKDIYLVEKTSTDALLIPRVEDVYPHGQSNLESYALGYLETVFEGQYRPGHFQGVCQVMDRLLTMVRPDKLFMGQKDFQQCLVVEKLLSVNHPHVELVRCPTVRESDGLAMSSRNLRLTEKERHAAPNIYKTLLFIRDGIKKGVNPDELRASAARQLAENGFTVDYVEIADARNLQQITGTEPGRPLVILVAAFLNEVRLIDNMLITV